MKDQTNKTRLAFLLFILGGGTLLATPETMEMREPEAIKVVKPVVPYEFSRYEIEGEVEVTFRIDEQGRTQDIEVETASHPEYAISVKNALRQWRFEQPEVGGLKYRLPVLFN
jgi:TonB family protein